MDKMAGVIYIKRRKAEDEGLDAVKCMLCDSASNEMRGKLLKKTMGEDKHLHSYT